MSDTKKVAATPPVQKVSEEKQRELLMMMQHINDDNGVDFTENQVDKILEQKGKVFDYIHEERMQEHERYKIQSRDGRFYFGWVLVFFVLLLGTVIFRVPEYTSQVLSGVFGLLSGLGIGTSIGYKLKKEN